MRMIQRLEELFRASPGAVLDEWFELEARGCTYVVSFDTALRVRQQLEQFPQPEWVEFTDLFGATQCVRSQDCFRISESTPRTRSAVRAFLAQRRQEEETPDPSQAVR